MFSIELDFQDLSDHKNQGLDFLMKNLRDTSRTFITHKNGQFILFARSQFKFLFTIQLIKGLEVPLFFTTRANGCFLSCSILISHSQIRKFISETGYGIFIQKMHNWNIDNKQIKMSLSRRKDITITQFLPINSSTHLLYEKILPYLTHKTKNFLIDFIVQTDHFAKLISSESHQLKALRSFFQKNSIQRQKIKTSTKQIDNENQGALLQRQLLSKMKKKLAQQFTSQPILSLIEIKERKEISQQKISIGYNSFIKNYYFRFIKYLTEFSMNKEANNLMIAERDESSSLNTSIFQESSDQNEQKFKKMVSTFKKQKSSLNTEIDDIESPTSKFQNQKIEQVKKVQCQQILVQKKPLPHDVLPFEIQYKTLKYLRNSFCPYIASYYFTNTGNQVIEDTLYIDFYKFNMVDNLKNSYCFSFILKLIKGIHFISNLGLSHRDLKSNNVMIDEACNPKIIDFGSTAFHYGSKMNSILPEGPFRTTKIYNKLYSEAPAQIQQKYSKQEYERHQLYDIYAFGQILRIILYRYEVGKFMEQNLEYIIEKCTQENPDNRLSPNEITVYLQELLKCQQSWKC